MNRTETWSELHEEVASLPEKLRMPIVLCYLEGLTAEAAAQQLGCPRGTVLSRLSRARERLRERLTRRGVSLSSGLPLYATKSAVPDGLSHSTVQAAIRIYSGQDGGRDSPGVGCRSHRRSAEDDVSCQVDQSRGGHTGHRRDVRSGWAWSSVRRWEPRRGSPRPDGRERRSPPYRAKTIPHKRGKNRAGRSSSARPISRALAKTMGSREWLPSTPKTGEVADDLQGALIRPGPVSPDGRYIVYSSLGPDPDEDQVGIWVYDMKGETAPRRIFERKGEPFWTNHGQQVVIGTPVGQTVGEVRNLARQCRRYRPGQAADPRERPGPRLLPRRDVAGDADNRGRGRAIRAGSPWSTRTEPEPDT